MARAESLLKNYSLLKEQRLLSLASGPGMRISSADRGCCHLRKWAPALPSGPLVALLLYKVSNVKMELIEYTGSSRSNTCLVWLVG